MQGFKKFIEYLQDEKYRNLDYGTIYYVAGNTTLALNEYVKSQAKDIAEQVNKNDRNWVTCKIVYLDLDNTLFPAHENAAFYSELIPTEGLNIIDSFLVAVLFDCEPCLMFDAFSDYFDTLQMMLDESLEKGRYEAYHLDPVDFSKQDDSILFSISGDPFINPNYPPAPHFDKPSRLEITPNTYQFLLPDYNQEFHFTAQVKALYVLFLNHPEGIMMSEISNYKEEYTRLYLRFTNRSDVDQLRNSVEKLFDVFSPNAMHVKKSQCNNAIHMVIPQEELYYQYKIQVNRGLAHLISLNRSLVSMPDDLRM